MFYLTAQERAEAIAACGRIEEACAKLQQHAANALAIIDKMNSRAPIEPERPVPDLLAALQNIAESHVPDQPCTDPSSELVWCQRHVAKLRKIAMDAVRKATGA